MKYLTTKNLVIAIVLFFAVLISIIVYRMFIEFNSKDVSIYIDEEASKYPENKKEVYALIQDGVEYILSSHNLTQQIKKTAKGFNTPKEQELVHAAIMQCKIYGYLNTKEE